MVAIRGRERISANSASSRERRIYAAEATTPSSRVTNPASILNPARFWLYVDRSGGFFACWPWLRSKDRDGYGIVGPGKRAHRVAYEIANGERPTASVLHHCDNPTCCNPSHLYNGTQQDNMRDRHERGRTATGSRNGRYKHGKEVGRSQGRLEYFRAYHAARKAATHD